MYSFLNFFLFHSFSSFSCDYFFTTPISISRCKIFLVSAVAHIRSKIRAELPALLETTLSAFLCSWVIQSPRFKRWWNIYVGGICIAGCIHDFGLRSWVSLEAMFWFWYLLFYYTSPILLALLISLLIPPNCVFFIPFFWVGVGCNLNAQLPSRYVVDGKERAQRPRVWMHECGISMVVSNKSLCMYSLVLFAFLSITPLFFL